MASELARERAAQAWCKESTSGKIMDPVLAEVFAEILDEEWSKPLTRDLVKALKSDPELYFAYQSNIAVPFMDECRRNKVYSSKLHKIANDAAKYFLNLLISQR